MSLDADAASALVSAKAARRPEPIRRFNDDIVTELLWVDIFAWCNERGVCAPSAVAATLHAWVDQLAAHGCLAPGSDPVDVLHDCINAAGGVVEPAGRHDIGAGPNAG